MPKILTDMTKLTQNVDFLTPSMHRFFVHLGVSEGVDVHDFASDLLRHPTPGIHGQKNSTMSAISQDMVRKVNFI